jgi:aminoglycoside 3-N-acetyltransferase
MMVIKNGSNMKEADVIKKTKKGPVTVDTLREDFRALGVEPGSVLLVHSSLSSLGWVNGGPVAVILALEEILGQEGTLVMPSHSSGLSDPKDWCNPPVPEDWKDTIRQTMPVYEKDLTPCRSMGMIPETFRKQTGVRRSDHPQVSFSAWGKQAEFITREHQLDFALGDSSPLGRMYELGAWILLLGVKHDSNTSLHLAEFRAVYPGKKEIKQGVPSLENGKRIWREIIDVEDHVDDFKKIGHAYRKSGGELRSGKVGGAKSTLIPQRDLVDFAVAWMETHRDLRGKGLENKDGK